MTLKVDRDRLQEIISRFCGQPILVVGDLMLDRFLWGRVERISPEAPVPVVEIADETVHLGGAANVAFNLSVMGARPLLIGAVGRDEAGRALIEQLQLQGISTEGIIEEPRRTTSVKTRIIAHHQQVCRTDREGWGAREEKEERKIREVFDFFLQQAAAGVLSDYAKGLFVPPLLQSLIQRTRETGRFLAVDPKSPDFSIYRGASLVTPNRKEAERASGIAIVDEEAFLAAGRRLLSVARSDYLLITRGEEGMMLFEGDRHTNIPTAAHEVFDVTGAGDTVIATLTLAMAAGASMGEAAILANHAAGIVVGKLGTAAATAEEIRASLPLRPVGRRKYSHSQRHLEPAVSDAFSRD